MSTSREDIVKSVRYSIDSLKSSGQKLTEATIPDDVFRQANQFVSVVVFRDRYEHHRLFGLLLSRAQNSPVPLNKTRETIKKWQAGLSALLRYPMDLLLAPNRPELKIIKLASGFYEYQINRKLLNAKEFFSEIGYKQYSSSHSDLVLKDTSKLVSAIADIVILHEDLSIALGVSESVLNSMTSQTVSGRQIFLHDVLIARQQAPPEKMKCINFLMTELSQVHGSSLGSGAAQLDYGLRPQTYPPSSPPSSQANDDEPTSTIRTRKNPSKIPLNQTSSRSSPVQPLFSSPEDASKLPPPAMTQSQVLRMMEEHKKQLEDSFIGASGDYGDSEYQEQSDRFDLSASQEGSDLTRQMYRPFDTDYRSVLFSIGGNENKEEECPPVMSQLPSNNKPIPLPRRGISKGKSLDIDAEDPPAFRKPFRHNSSEGNLLGSGINQRLLSRGTNEVSDYGIHGDGTSERESVVGARSNIRRGSDNTLLEERPVPSPRMQRNLAGSDNNSSKKMFSKDISRYDDVSSVMALDRTNSSTWAGESHRQYVRQMSRNSGISHVISDSPAFHKPVTSTGAAAVSGTQGGWKCACGEINKHDFPQCVHCEKMAPWVDISPLLSPKRPPPTNVNPSNGDPRKIAMDFTPRDPQALHWECVFCASLNDNHTFVCRFCGSADQYH